MHVASLSKYVTHVLTPPLLSLIALLFMQRLKSCMYVAVSVMGPQCVSFWVEAIYYLLTHCGGPLTDAQSADDGDEDQIEHVDASSISSLAEILLSEQLKCCHGTAKSGCPDATFVVILVVLVFSSHYVMSFYFNTFLVSACLQKPFQEVIGFACLLIR